MVPWMLTYRSLTVYRSPVFYSKSLLNSCELCTIYSGGQRVGTFPRFSKIIVKNWPNRAPTLFKILDLPLIYTQYFSANALPAKALFNVTFYCRHSVANTKGSIYSYMYISLLLQNAKKSKTLMYMEDLDITKECGQKYGFILYRASIPKVSFIRLSQLPRDRAQVNEHTSYL